MLKRSTRSCPICSAPFRTDADDDQHLANMRADAELVEHLAAAHPIGAPRG